jgi:hypothetical protein
MSRRNLGRGAEGVLAARTRLIKLVLPAGRNRPIWDAVRIREAIDMLERAAYRDGALAERAAWQAPPPPAPPVTAAELEEVRRCVVRVSPILPPFVPYDPSIK